MKRVFLAILTLVIILNFKPACISASMLDEKFIQEANEILKADVENITIDNSFVFDLQIYSKLEEDYIPIDLFVIIKDTDSNYYYLHFDSGKYSKTYENPSIFKQALEFDTGKINSYLSEYELSDPTDIKCTFLMGRLSMYIYNFKCAGKQYVIPYAKSSDSVYNVTNDKDLDIEMNKVYDVKNFMELCDKENDVYTDYISKQNEKSLKDGSVIYTDAEDVEHGNEEENVKQPNVDSKNDKSDYKDNNSKMDEFLNDEKNDNKSDDKLSDTSENDKVLNADNKPEDNPKDDTKEPEKVKFEDVPENHWAYDDISSLVEKKIILGYGDGRFGTNDSVTSEQVTLLLDRLFEYKTDDNSALPAKRESIIVSIVKALNADVSGADASVINEKFNDCETINAEDRQYIAYAIDSGLVKGYDGKLNPEDNVTRAETAALLCRALKIEK